MSDRLGPISFDDSSHSLFIGRDFGTTKSYSEETAAVIDEEVKRIFDEASKRCEALLTEHRETLVNVAEYLLQHESMDGADFDYFCDHGELPPKKEPPKAAQPTAPATSAQQPAAGVEFVKEEPEAPAPGTDVPPAEGEYKGPDERPPYWVDDIKK